MTIRWQHCETEDDWLAARMKGVGGSEVAAILGLSRYSSPWAVWRRKVDRVIEKHSPSDMAEWGHRLEPAIAQKFDEVVDHGGDLIDPGHWSMVWSPECEHLFVTPDRCIVHGRALSDADELVVFAADEIVISALEIKTAHHRSAKEWEERIPLGYQAQLQAAMHCLGCEVGYFAALLNGYDFRWYKVELNARFVASLLRRVQSFWRYVQDKTAPPTDFSGATREALAAHYSEPVEDTVELPYEFWEVHKALQSEKAKKREAERKIAGYQNQIKAAMGNATLAVLNDEETGFAWRPNKNGTRVFKETKINSREAIE